METRLTKRQNAFIDAFSGDAVEAAIAAGYSEKTAHVAATKLMKNPKIIRAIDKRAVSIDLHIRKEKKLIIATREERKAFWTKVVNDPKTKMSDRLKASELLAKSECDFINKTEITGDSKITIVRKDYTKPQLKSVA